MMAKMTLASKAGKLKSYFWLGLGKKQKKLLRKHLWQCDISQLFLGLFNVNIIKFASVKLWPWFLIYISHASCLDTGIDRHLLGMKTKSQVNCTIVLTGTLWWLSGFTRAHPCWAHMAMTTVSSYPTVLSSFWELYEGLMMGIIGVWPPTSTSSSSLNLHPPDSSVLMPPIEWPDPEMLLLESHVRNCLPFSMSMSHGTQIGGLSLKYQNIYARKQKCTWCNLVCIIPSSQGCDKSISLSLLCHQKSEALRDSWTS